MGGHRVSAVEQGACSVASKTCNTSVPIIKNVFVALAEISDPAIVNRRFSTRGQHRSHCQADQTSLLELAGAKKNYVLRLGQLRTNQDVR